MFLYIDRAYIIHLMMPNNGPRSNAGICKLSDNGNFSPDWLTIICTFNCYLEKNHYLR